MSRHVASPAPGYYRHVKGSMRGASAASPAAHRAQCRVPMLASRDVCAEMSTPHLSLLNSSHPPTWPMLLRGAAPRNNDINTVIPKPQPQGCSHAAPCHAASLRVEEHLHLQHGGAGVCFPRAAGGCLACPLSLMRISLSMCTRFVSESYTVPVCGRLFPTNAVTVTTFLLLNPVGFPPPSSAAPGPGNHSVLPAAPELPLRHLPSNFCCSRAPQGSLAYFND